MFPERKCQVTFPSYLSQDVSAVVRFRMFLKNWPYKHIFQNSDHKKVLAKTVLPRNTCEIKNDNKFNNFQLF